MSGAPSVCGSQGSPAWQALQRVISSYFDFGFDGGFDVCFGVGFDDDDDDEVVTIAISISLFGWRLLLAIAQASIANRMTLATTTPTLIVV